MSNSEALQNELIVQPTHVVNIQLQIAKQLANVGLSKTFVIKLRKFLGKTFQRLPKNGFLTDYCNKVPGPIIL